MKLDLDVQLEWTVKCWQCSNQHTSPVASAQQAIRGFKAVGWRRNPDGEQLCPACWRDVRAPWTLGDAR